MDNSCFVDDLNRVVVYSCNNDVLDFSLQFQQVVFSLVPSCVFIAACAVRLYFLRRTAPKVDGAWHLGWSKWCVISALCGLQLALLILRAHQKPASVTSTVLSLVDGALIGLLSWQEHSKSIRPSAVLEVYLVISLILDAIYCRSLWIRNDSLPIRSLAIIAIIIKLLLLALESTSKKQWLKSEFRSRSPEELSGFPNRAIFYWLDPLLITGSRKRLELQDLYILDKALDPTFAIQLFWQRWQSLGETKLKALRVTASLLRVPLILPVVPRILLIFFTFCQPLLLNELLANGLPNAADLHSTEGPYLIVGYAAVFLGLAFSTLFYWHNHYRFLVAMRGVICSAIFTKTLEMSQDNVKDLAAVTLMSTEMERILFAFRLIHECWASVIEIVVATYLLSRFVGPVPCLVPLLVALVSAICCACLSSAAGKKQAVWTEAVRHRVTTTSTVLSSMKGIKLSGLEPKLSGMIQDLRVEEVSKARQLRWLLVISSAIAFTPVLISPPLTFVAYVYMSSSFTVPNASVLFTSISLMTILNQPLSQLFQMIPNLIAAVKCFSVIDGYLKANATVDCRVNSGTSSDSFTDDGLKGLKRHSSSRTPEHDGSNYSEKYEFSIKNGDFGWIAEKKCLENLDISIPKGELTMVIGPVGSGKSLLCAVLLGEAYCHRGEVKDFPESGNIAFCSQAPWLTNVSIRDAVCQYTEFDETWYSSTLEAVAFKEDLAAFPRGDSTKVGPNGNSLSGGQRQRLALARAIYARKPVVILDDVFSALDGATERVVFNKVLGPEGILRSLRSTVILATNAVEHLPLSDHIIALGESGRVSQVGPFHNLVLTAGYVKDMFESVSKREDGLVSASLTLPTNLADAEKIITLDEKTDAIDPFAHIQDLRVYAYYLKAIGVINAVLQLCFVVSYATLAVFPPVVIRWWTASQGSLTNRNSYFLGVYGGLQGFALLALSIFAYQSLLTVIASSGTNLHLEALQTVMHASLSYFSSTNVGSILSRFSQDMQLIDTELPISLLNVLSSSLLTIGQAVVMCTGSPYTGIALPFLLIPFYIIQKFYLRTSRQLRHMDLDYKEPLYSHFLETSNGLSTLRAFGWSGLAVQKNDSILQDSQRPFYLLYAIQRWLTFTLDIIVCILAVVIVTLAVMLRAGAGFTGVALVSLMGINISIKNLVTQWTIFETTIGAVSRLKNLGNNIVKESQPGSIKDPPPSWPSSGGLEVSNLSVSYDNGESFALRNVNLTIPPGLKIGICGRTGSGKSTLILALLRLVPFYGGSIRLSDVDLTTVPLPRLREAMNAVSQDPFFLPGSARVNLDPAGKCSDERITALLSCMGLLQIIKSRGGLSAQFDAESLSAGQKQLVFFARAVLRGGPLVVLDEITSNVDRATDVVMQQVIREEFGKEGRTLIVVSHRVETFFDFDSVVVMAQGQVLDVGTPEQLKSRCGVYNSLLRGG